jgi:type I restriction enzyme, S subunit
MSSEWPLFSLEDCLDALIDYRGKTPEKTASGIPLITAKVIKGGRIETPNEFIAIDNYDAWMRRGIPECGDVVLTVEAPLGEVAQLGPEKIALAQRVVTLRGKAKFLDSTYLLYWLQSEDAQEQLKARATGTTVIGIKQSELRKLSVPIPPFSVQQEVAEILRSLDDRITLLRATNTTLEAIAQALFKSWFVDFDPVHAKMQGRAPEGMDEATAALFPESFEESTLGAVPKGWKAQAMADVSSVRIGKTPPRKEPQWFSENATDVRWVSIRDMGALGIYASRTSEFLTREAVEKFNVRVVPDNTVLMSFKLTVGRVALTDGEMTTNEAIAHFKLDEKSPVTSEFIYLYLKQFDFSSLSSTSSIADAVNSKTVREIPISVPPPVVVAAFQASVAVIFKQLKNGEDLATNLAGIRDTLLPRLISGQLRVNSIAELVES